MIVQMSYLMIKFFGLQPIPKGQMVVINYLIVVEDTKGGRWLWDLLPGNRLGESLA